MSLLSRALGIRASFEDPNIPLGWGVLTELFGWGGETESGALVTPLSALQLSAVHACVRVIAETIAGLPLEIHQTAGDTELLARSHRLWPILHDEPNPQMTAITFRECMTAQCLLWGNGYAEVQRDRSGRVVALWPLPSQNTRPVMLGGKLKYETLARPALGPYAFQIGIDDNTGSPRYIDPGDMLHIPGLSFNGLVGFSPIELARRTIGLSIAADKFGALFFGNGSRPSGILSHPKALRAETRKNIAQSFREATSRENAHKAIVLEEGVTWTPMTVPPDDAQFLETRQFQIAEIARIYRVPLHLIQDLSRSTNNNIEQQSREFVMHTMRPWAVRWEQEIVRKLLAGPFSARHDFSDLLRGDFQTRMQGYQVLRNAGVISTNDIRTKEGWNPVAPEEGGDTLIVPLNMTPLATLGDEPDDSADQADSSGTEPNTADGAEPGSNNADALRRRMSAAYTRIFRDAAGRAMKREKRGPEAMRAIFAPAVTAMAEGLIALEFAYERGLSADAHILIAEVAASTSLRCREWASDNLDIVAEREAAIAFDALYAKFATLTEDVQ